MTIAATATQSASTTGASQNPSVALGAAPAQNALLVAMVIGISAPTESILAANGYTKLTDVGTATRHAALLWKVAGAGESATQAPCTLGVVASVWCLGVVEWPEPTDGWDELVITDNATIDTDPTKTMNSACDPPTDSIPALFVGGACDSGTASTWSTEKINNSTSGVVRQQQVAQITAGSIDLWTAVIASIPAGNQTSEALCSANTNGSAHLAVFRESTQTIKFRKTLSGIGTGVAKRQAIGMGD